MLRWVTSILGLALCLAGEATGQVTNDITFTATHDGTAQKYIQVLPAAFDANVPHDVLIAFHGHGSDRWQFVTGTLDEGRAARDVAASNHMIYISPDYRARTSWMGPAAEADVLQLIGDLKQKHRVARVFICGASMGGTASLTFAVRHPELVAGVASMNGTANLLLYENFADAIKTSYGGTRAKVPLEYKQRSAEYWPETLTMPVGLTTSGKDTVVPPDSVQRLAKALEAMNRKVLLLHREAMGHNTSYDDAVAILNFAIQNAQPPR